MTIRPLVLPFFGSSSGLLLFLSDYLNRTQIFFEILDRFTIYLEKEKDEEQQKVMFILLLLAPTYALANFPKSDLDPASIPPYNEGSDYYIDINDGVPDFEVWQRTAFPFVLFSPLDDLGRAGAAYACLGPETLRPTLGDRWGISSLPDGGVPAMRIWSTAAICIIAPT